MTCYCCCFFSSDRRRRRRRRYCCCCFLRVPAPSPPLASNGNRHDEQYYYQNDIPKNPQLLALKLIGQPTTLPISTYHLDYPPKVADSYNSFPTSEAAFMMSTDKELYKLELLSLVSKVSQELFNHTKLQDKKLAEFVIAVGLSFLFPLWRF